MTYSAQELSVESGQPIELYDFRLGSEEYQWTTNAEEVEYDGITYSPIPISRESLVFSPEQRAEALRITVPANTALVRKYINSVPGQRATMTIRRVHRNDGADEVVQLFKGTVRTVGFSQNGLEAQIAVLPITADLTDSIPRFKFSSSCNHVLYDDGCSVASSLHRHADVVTAVDGDMITVDGLNAKGDGWAVGGFIALATGDYRMVIAHTGDDIRVLLPFPENINGDTVEVFAGCDHSIGTCSSKFGNVPNFGGYAFVPLRNIFTSGLN